MKETKLKKSMKEIGDILNNEKIIQPPIQVVKSAKEERAKLSHKMLTVFLPSSLMKRLKLFSVAEDSNIKDIVLIAIEEYLDRNETFELTTK